MSWRLTSIYPRPSTFIHRLPSINVCPSMSVRRCSSLSMRHILQIICTMYIRIKYRILQIISSALYFYKILGHGTTPCPQMMRALLLNQSQSINYEVTHNHLKWFLWTHNLHDGTIKRLQHHHHLVQLLPGIQVQVTLHQLYIKVHLEGLINGVRLLPHLLSHHHHIFWCKPLPLHPYTPWRLTISLRKLKNLTKGQVPFHWGSSRQLFQLWFVNWNSSMVLITPRRSHSNN